ncbi:MAG: AtpZ/AtpI family protein [Armatimonadetes bacterium]|nr:AtpZ/AtpI family protein [Armatimonadota bacterium]
MWFGSKEGREASRALAQFGSLGVALALSVAFFAWVGLALDRRFGTEPVGVAVMSLLGSAAALYKVIRDVSRWNDDKDD